MKISLKEPKKPKEKRVGMGAALRALSVTTVIGIEMAVAVTIGFYSGRYIDSKLDTDPLFLIICLLLGLAAGIIGVVKAIQMLFKEKA